MPHPFLERLNETRAAQLLRESLYSPRPSLRLQHVKSTGRLRRDRRATEHEISKRTRQPTENTEPAPTEQRFRREVSRRMSFGAAPCLSNIKTLEQTQQTIENTENRLSDPNAFIGVYLCSSVAMKGFRSTNSYTPSSSGLPIDGCRTSARGRSGRCASHAAGACTGTPHAAAMKTPKGSSSASGFHKKAPAPTRPQSNRTISVSAIRTSPERYNFY